MSNNVQSIIGKRRNFKQHTVNNSTVHVTSVNIVKPNLNFQFLMVSKIPMVAHTTQSRQSSFLRSNQSSRGRHGHWNARTGNKWNTKYKMAYSTICHIYLLLLLLFPIIFSHSEQVPDDWCMPSGNEMTVSDK